jgi:ABC-type transport system involved in multi-copper enzyme maturation permease subunit
METVRIKKHTTIGLISLISAILTIVLVIITLSLLFAGIGELILILISIVSFLCLILPIIAIILGAFAYFSKNKDTYGLIGFILGIILIVTVPVANAATVYVYVSGMLAPPSGTIPNIYFNRESDMLNVTYITEPDVLWSNFEISGDCNTSNLGIYIQLGDKITNCTGTIQLYYKPIDGLFGSWEFE